MHGPRASAYVGAAVRDSHPREEHGPTHVTERVFLPWREPVLRSAARLLAERHADGGELPLDRVLVVVQAARAGRRLVELLLEEADRRGAVLTPPETVTIGQLPERLYRPDRPTAGGVTAVAAWSAALRGLGPARLAPVFPDPPEADDAAGWDRLARRVLELHRETAAEGLDFARVARACRGGRGFDDSRRWEVLAEAQEAYHRRLDSMGYVDPDRARALALEAGDLDAGGRDVHLVGIVELGLVVRRMLQALAEPVTALIHAPAEWEDRFDALGCVRPGAWEDAEIDLPGEDLLVVGRPPAQAEAVLRCLGGAGGPLAPDQVTVGVPDPTLVPYLEQRLREHGVPRRHAAGTPLARTDPFRLLAAVADYLAQDRFRDFAALLRHPDVEAGLGVAGALAATDRHFEEHLPGRVDGSRRPPVAGRTDFRRVVEALESELGLGRLRGRRSTSEWMPDILALLARVYGERSLERSKPGDRRLVEACEALRDAAEAFARLPEPLDETCGADQALHRLLQEVERRQVPPDPDRSAVEMLGWLELHLDDAPVLILTGMDEDHVPGSVGADLFLPDGLRARLGLRDDRRRYARDAYLLSAMLAPRREARLVVGRRTVEGDPLRPSRLLLATPEGELALRAAKLFSDETVRPPRLARPGVRPAPESAFSTPPRAVLTVPEPPERLRVTDFRLLLRSPYQFVLRRILGLERVDDRARELDGLRFGELAHAVLHGFAESDAARSDDVREATRALDALLEREVAGRFGPDVLPAVRLQAALLEVRLHDFAAWHVARTREGWETVAAEVETPGGGAPFPVDDRPILLSGRIDRIDRHRHSGRWAILDYKTAGRGRPPDRTHRAGRRGDRRWTDLQLPLYRHLLPAMAEAGRVPGELGDPEAPLLLGYVNLSREATELARADWTRDELAEADEAAREAVRRLRAGSIEFRADERVRRDSPFADLLGQGRLVAAGSEDEDGESEDDGGEA